MGGRQQLTHDEIWDDSALIDSWNEALDEYKASIKKIGGALPFLSPIRRRVTTTKTLTAHATQRRNTTASTREEAGPRIF